MQDTEYVFGASADSELRHDAYTRLRDSDASDLSLGGSPTVESTIAGTRYWTCEVPLVLEVPADIALRVEIVTPGGSGDWRAGFSRSSSVMLSTNSREAVVDPGISRGDRAEVRILVEGAAHIVGRFPPGSSAQTAAYVFASDGRKFGEFEYATPDEFGAFATHGLDEGCHRVQCTWTESDGSLALASYDVRLEPGEVRDLGTLAAGIDGTVLLDPVLYVDGERDPSLLGGALRDARMHLVATRSNADDPESDEEGYDFPDVALDRVSIRGATAGRYSIGAFDIRLPDAVASDFAVEGWALAEFDFDGGETSVEFPVRLVSTHEVVVHFELPDGDSLGVTEQRLQAWGVAPSRMPIDLPPLQSSLGDAARTTWDSVAPIPPGTWCVVAAVGRMTKDGRIERLVASLEIEVEPDGPRTFFVRFVTPATASVTLPPGFVEDPTRPLRVHPFAIPNHRTRIGSPGDGSSTVQVENLLPNTEYVLEPFGTRFTTGAPGTTIEVAAH